MKEPFYHTVSPALLQVLKICMASRFLKSFRLVGGTALGLQRGHRKSDDIDLFTSAAYGSVDFESITRFLSRAFPYFDSRRTPLGGLGGSCFVGASDEQCVKVDLYHTDDFIDDVKQLDGIRLAGIRDIIAMKMDVIGRGGRKKDFWDIHELSEDYSLQQMLELHKLRYPYTHDEALLREKFTDFSLSDDDFDPICLRAKHWELIKLDLIEMG